MDKSARIAAVWVGVILIIGCGPKQPQGDPKASSDLNTAEGQYMRGRDLEACVVPDQSKAKQNLQAARSAYIQALAMKPSPELEAYIRASLGNVAYFQDDYATALQQWDLAYPKLDNADTKAWVLYRKGVCQQRVGQFAEADKTFASVRANFPNTVPAQRAAEHVGVRGFYVQLATFGTPGGADSALAKLRGQGVTPVKLRDPKGHDVLRVGPVGSYTQAMTLKNRFAATYPDAMVVP